MPNYIHFNNRKLKKNFETEESRRLFKKNTLQIKINIFFKSATNYDHIL